MIQSEQKMKSFITLFLVLFILNFSACANKNYVYKEVKIPTKCDIPKREKPKKESNITAYLKAILIYTEGLERDLAFCRGEEAGS